MQIQTFSIVVGSRACNAQCPFCVSAMTGFDQVSSEPGHLDEQGFNKAARLAELGGCTTALLTGKGEPTLFPKEITRFLDPINRNHNFPIIELQTNGISIGRLANKMGHSNISTDNLFEWRRLGLDTIAISVVSIHNVHNKEIYLGNKSEYPDLATTIGYLRAFGFTVRLCVMMSKTWTCSYENVLLAIQFAKRNHVSQLTFRPIVSTTKKTENKDVNTFIEHNGLSPRLVKRIYGKVDGDSRATRIMSLVHGATVYDFDGQNVCMSNCLTNEPEKTNEIRTLIYYSSGEISYDWQYKGAIIRDSSQ